MPAKNVVKQFLEHGHYHIYNRGVDKRDIFLDDQDYKTFLSLLKSYLGPPPSPSPSTDSPYKTEKPSLLKHRHAMNLTSEAKLLAYCLMPNHFHLLVKQNTPHAITKLIRRVATSYVTYFNQKYDRSGTLFQGTYRAVLVQDEPYLLHLSRYIHLNPAKTTKLGPITTAGSPAHYPYSSYQWYLSPTVPEWLDTATILSYFQKNRNQLPNPYTSYTGFVEDYRLDSVSYLQNLTLEEG